MFLYIANIQFVLACRLLKNANKKGGIFNKYRLLLQYFLIGFIACFCIYVS